MIDNCLYKTLYRTLFTGLALWLTGCSSPLEVTDPDAIAPGEAVMFTTALPQAPATRSARDEYNDRMAAYKAVTDDYEFTVQMYSAGDNLVGSGTYRPVKDNNTTGTLTAATGATKLYWTSTTVPYAFKATAGTPVLESDQTTPALWLRQDRLEGYGYIQKWDETNAAPVDLLDALNYHTAIQWRSLNKETKLVQSSEDYKKIPLYLQHKRALITVILKAGEGVSRQALAFDVAGNDLSAEIYSYSTSAQPIQPLCAEQLIHYDADKNGAAADEVSTTRYDAIVEPYDYAEGDRAATEPIVRISLSGQHYSFYAGNDTHFDANKGSYNLEAGKHLTLTVILSRDSRKVLISAQIQDWTEEVTSTICDDYGNAGEPIRIKTRDELIDFLADGSKNKAGNIALVTANINLEETSATYPGNWSAYNTYDLDCTLSLGGMTLSGDHRFLRDLGGSASLQNGTIQVGGTVDTAIAATNSGTIDDVLVTAKDGTDAHATVAGAVKDNRGTISRVRSSLRVQGDAGTPFVGGIAATSLSSPGMLAAIDACTVTGGVKGGVKGGGIVGKASGYVTGNSFEYGITLLQNKDTHKNIVAQKDDDHTLQAGDNAWPTKDENPGMENATAAERRYDGIIDDEAELKKSVTATYNTDGKRYRLSRDITVTGTVGSVACELDGNGRQITTSAMIFQEITGLVHSLTVYVAEDLTTTQNDNSTDATAPLAFEVHGEQAQVRDVKVKMADGTRIQSSNPAGMVVWVWDGATVSGCEARVNLYANVKEGLENGRKFAGGIVSTVSRGTVTRCILHSGSTFAGTSSVVTYYGGIVGGIQAKNDSNDVPALTITDCTSFLALTPKDAYHGDILGNALLGTDHLATKDCQGNWWDAESRGVGTCTGHTAEAAIGRRNAVTPTEKSF